jgi:hypothetical protein
MLKKLPSQFVGILVSPIKEVFQEIIEDGFREALAENIVDICGGTEDFGFWLSSMWTSSREIKGALGELSLGKGSNLRTAFSLLMAKVKGDTKTFIALNEEMALQVAEQQTIDQQKEQDRKLWQKLLRNNIVRGLFMMAPAFFGGFSFMALLGATTMIDGLVNFDSKLYSDVKAWYHAQQDQRIQNMPQNSLDNVLIGPLLSDRKQSSELNAVKGELSQKIEEQQEVNKEQVLVSSATIANPDPRNVREKLATTFHKIKMMSWVKQLIQDYRFKDYIELFEQIAKNSGTIDFANEIEEVKKVVRKALEDYPTLLRFVDYDGEFVFDLVMAAFGIRPGRDVHKRVQFGGLGSFTYEEDIPYNTKTSDYANHLQTVFDTDTAIRIYMLRGKELVRIPQSAIIRKWLQDQNFNKKSDAIILLPDTISSDEQALFIKHPDWENSGKPSFYSPYFEDFIIELGLLLEQYLNLIPEDSKKTYSDREVNKYIYLLGAELLGDRERLWKALSDLENGKNWALGIDRLDFLYLDMKTGLENLIETRKVSRNPLLHGLLLKQFDNLFINLYRVFGKLGNNLYKHESRLILRELILYLNNIGDINIKIEGTGINTLSEVMGYVFADSFLSYSHNRDEPKPLDVIIKHLILSPMHYILDKYNLIGLLDIEGKVFDLSYDNIEDVNLDGDWLWVLEKVEKIKFASLHQQGTGGAVSNALESEINNYKDSIFKILLPLINKAVSYWSIDNYFDTKGYPRTPTRDFIANLLGIIGFGPEVDKA